MELSTALFALGRLVVSDAADAALADSGEEADLFLDRHVSGDWGEVRPARAAMNALALSIRKPIISAYRTRKGVELLVITDEARAATRVVRPDEYHPQPTRRRR